MLRTVGCSSTWPIFRPGMLPEDKLEAVKKLQRRPTSGGHGG
jgi:hypothetical protein